jgi:hypothetical protein
LIKDFSLYSNDMKDQIMTTTNLDDQYLKIKGTLQQGKF